MDSLLLLTSDGRLLAPDLGPEQAALAQDYWRAVRHDLACGSLDRLLPFAEVEIVDRIGTRYRFLVDLDGLYAVENALTDEEYRQYRIWIGGDA